MSQQGGNLAAFHPGEGETPLVLGSRTRPWAGQDMTTSLIDLITASTSLCSHLRKKNPIHKVNLGQGWMLNW